MAINFYQYTKSADKYGPIAKPEPVKADEPGLMGNMGRSFGSGALSATGGIFDFVGAEGVAKQFYGWSDDVRQGMSTEAQTDMAKPFFSESDQGEIQLGEGLTDLDTWLLTMANVAGQFAPTAIPGAGIAGAATKALKLGETGAKVAAAAGMGVTGGASATGQGMEQARQEWLQMPDEVKFESEFFKNTMRELNKQNPQLLGEDLWLAAEQDVAQRLAAEVQTDPKVLLANFAGSAIADPIIGKALTGARLAKSGALRSALKGFAIEGSTEAAQAGVQEYGINQALSQVDGRNPMDGVAVAALNEGVAGGTLGGAAGLLGGFANRKPAEPVRDKDADAIRDSNPTLAGAFDSVAQSSAQREADLQSVVGGLPAISQPVLEGELLDPEQAAGPNYNPNQIGMQARIGGPTIPRIEQKDIIFAADGRTEAERNPAMEGEWLSPEQRAANAAAGFIENAPIDLESEQLKQAKADMERMRNQPRQITDKNIIFTGDGRPQQAAQEFADNLQRQANQTASVPRLPQKDIIFAGDQSGVRVKGNGQVYQSPREAMTSKQARAMKRSGVAVEAVPFADGWGWRVKESQPEQTQQPEQTAQVVEPAPVQFKKSGKPFQSEKEMKISASYREAAAGGAELETVKVDGGFGFRVKVVPAADLSGEAIDREWTAFAEDSGTLKIPRAEMPQIKAEHRGAMTQFLKARGVRHEQDTVLAAELKPTQAEFSPSKVAKAMEFDGGDRSILVSSDGYVLDGHHQWLAKRERGEQVDIIRFDAPIAELVKQAHEFPSSTVADGANIENTTQIGTSNKNEPIKNQEGNSAQQGGLFTAGNAGAAESGAQSGQERQGSSAERTDGPDPEQSQKPAVTAGQNPKAPASAGVSVSKPTERIEDFGEKLGGARKDVWAGFSDAVTDDVDTEALPLSKSFPEPDYAKMYADGVPMETLAIIAAMRSEIPAKPRHPYKVRRWAEKVDVLRNFARDLISGELSPAQVITAMSKEGGGLQAIANAIPAIAQASPETIKLAAKYRLGSGSYSMFRGQEYRPVKTFYYPQNGRSEMLDLASPDKQTALDNLSKLIKAEAAANPGGSTKQSKISIYRDRSTDQIYLGWSGGSGVLRIQNFDSVAEARDYLKSNRDDVEAKLKQLKQVPEMRRPENRDRVGPARYAGTITPAIFADTFGFRGVEFGNWVEQTKRQKDLNEAYDALMDLADVLGVPPKALALNGELGMAFGARGKGAATTVRAKAHYEPSYVAINLTKESGAGSLAHEWWHAVDNYFARLSGNPSSFVTEGGNIRGGDLRPEVREAFTSLILAIRKTKVFQRAAALDSRRSKAYWSSEIEASARSFETFIISELEAKGFSNDYLANVVDQDVWDAIESGEQTYPYPTKAEQEIINPAFRSFFDTLQTKETDKGVMLFSKQNTIKVKPGKGLNPKIARQLADSIMSRLNGAAGIKVVILETQAEAEKLWQMSLAGELVRGAYNRETNTAYIIAENIRSTTQLRETLAHEVIGHGGLKTVIRPADYAYFIDRLKRTRNNKAFEKQWAKIDHDYDGFSEEDKAEEIFAYFVQDQPLSGQMKMWWNSLLRSLYKALQAVGLMQAGDPDIEAMQDMLQSIRIGFEVGRSGNQSLRGGERVVFSKTRTAEDMIDKVSDLVGRKKLDPNDPFAVENRRLKEQDRTLWDKAKQIFMRQFAPGGLLPRSIFDAKITRDGELESGELAIKHLILTLERAVQKDTGKNIDNQSDDFVQLMADALAGKVSDKLGNETKTALIAMRQYIDALSGDYLSVIQSKIDELTDRIKQDDKFTDKAQALNEIELYEKIKGNMGVYVNRSYRAFDDPKWFQKVPVEVINRAREYLRGQYKAQGDDQVEANRKAEVTLNKILKTDTAYDSMAAFITESKLGAKDLSTLIARKDISPEIRELLGEYKDPRMNFAKTATKMARLVWNSRFLNKVKADGVGVIFFDEDSRPAEATVQIAGDQSKTYEPLNGYWTYPEVAEALQDSLGTEKMEAWYEAAVKFTSMVKYGKTVLSPTTAMRNWQSAMFFAVANGHFDFKHMKKSMAAFREQVSQNASGDDLAYLKKLKKLGVVYDAPYAGEMMQLLADSKIDEWLEGRKGQVFGTARQINNLAQGFYSFGDDFWKIIGYENEKANFISAGLSEAEAEKMAAERIRNTYPTYSMVGRAIKKLARFPLMGTFVSFPAEIIRTTANMLRYAAQDMKSNNPAIRAMARKRLTGMALVSGMFYSLSAMTAAMLGVDDEEEEAIRDVGPSWQKNSTFLFYGRDDKGKLQYFDISFLDPYGYFKRPITAMLRDQPWTDAAASGAADMLSPFFGADITAGTFFQVFANKKQSGGQVYNEYADGADQLASIADHIWTGLRPGFVNNAMGIFNAAAGNRREGSGKEYDLGDEMMALMGWRASSLDAPTALYYRSFDFADQLQAANATLNKVLRSDNNVDDADIADAKEEAQRQYDDAFKQMQRIVQSGRNAGMTKEQVYRTLKLSGVSNRNISGLINGNIPPMQAATLQTQIKAVAKAREIRGDEQASEVLRRFQLARQLP